MLFSQRPALLCCLGETFVSLSMHLCSIRCNWTSFKWPIKWKWTPSVSKSRVWKWPLRSSLYKSFWAKTILANAVENRARQQTHGDTVKFKKRTFGLLKNPIHNELNSLLISFSFPLPEICKKQEGLYYNSIICIFILPYILAVSKSLGVKSAVPTL